MDAQPSWHLLAQLSELEDLALQCREDLACCAVVLAASQRTLQQVTLASKAWDTPTYRALQHLERLHHIILKVDSMSLEDAEVLAIAKLRQSGEMSLMLRKCTMIEPGVIQLLSRGDSHMTCLALYEASKAQVQELQTMATLQTLVVARPDFDGDVCQLQPQPNLRQLSMINCHGLSNNGVQWIPVAFPQVSWLAFLREQSDAPPVDLPDISSQALTSLSQCPKLHIAHIQGLNGLTRAAVRSFRQALRVQQRAGA